MSVSTRVIRRRIKSVTSTRKITKAMELVAASKMRRAVAATLGSRPYAQRAWTLTQSIAAVTDAGAHPLLLARDEIKKILLLVVTSDRGLCGGFNAQLTRAVQNFVKKSAAPIEAVTLGKKGQAALKRLHIPLVAAFPNLGHLSTILDVRPIAALAMNDYLSGKYDRVAVAYTDYRGAVNQRPLIFNLLPLAYQPELGSTGSIARETKNSVPKYEYVFEPSPQAALDLLLPRIVETQVYQAILESAASEHSSRMVAMKNASEAADEMIDDLTFTFNQARQASITREIAEISAGRAALE